MDFSERDMQDAAEIMERLFETDSEHPKIPIERNLVIADLEANIRRFKRELRMWQWLDNSFPGMRIGEKLVPVSTMSTAFPPAHQCF